MWRWVSSTLEAVHSSGWLCGNALIATWHGRGNSIPTPCRGHSSLIRFMVSPIASECPPRSLHVSRKREKTLQYIRSAALSFRPVEKEIESERRDGEAHSVREKRASMVMQAMCGVTVRQGATIQASAVPFHCHAWTQTGEQAIFCIAICGCDRKQANHSCHTTKTNQCLSTDDIWLKTRCNASSASALAAPVSKRDGRCRRTRHRLV